MDFTARVQAYDLDGKHLGIEFQTPDYRNGRPSGLDLTHGGELIVCDSHYHRLRLYAADGAETKVIGGAAEKSPSQFGYGTAVVQGTDDFFYVAEFGQNDRITKLDDDGRFVVSCGINGTGQGQFQRLRALALGPDGLRYAADACNHRIQVLTREGEFGGEDTEPGKIRYPYDLGFAPTGELYVVEYGNQHGQKFTADGRSLGAWGAPGGKPGQRNSPWALAVDRRGRVHVIDTENHRVQRVRF